MFLVTPIVIEKYTGLGVEGLYRLIKDSGLCPSFVIGYGDSEKFRPYLDVLRSDKIINRMVTPDSVEHVDIGILLELLEYLSYLPPIAARNIFKKNEIVRALFSKSRLHNITVKDLCRLIVLIAEIAKEELTKIFKNKDTSRPIADVVRRSSPKDAILFICSVAKASMDIFRIVVTDSDFRDVIKVLGGKNVLKLFIRLSQLNIHSQSIQNILRFLFENSMVAISLEEALGSIKLVHRLRFFEKLSSEIEILDVFPVKFISKFFSDRNLYVSLSPWQMMHVFLRIHRLLREHSLSVLKKLSDIFMRKIEKMEHLVHRIRLLSRLAREIDIHELLPQNFLINMVYDRKKYESWSPELLVDMLVEIRALGIVYNYIISQIKDLIPKIVVEQSRFSRLLSLLERIKELELIAFIPPETLFDAIDKPKIFKRLPLEGLIRILCRIHYISNSIFGQIFDNVRETLSEKIRGSTVKELCRIFSMKKKPWKNILDQLYYKRPKLIFIQTMIKILKDKHIRNVLESKARESRALSKVLTRFLRHLGIIPRKEKKKLEWAEITGLIELSAPTHPVETIDIYRGYIENLGPILVWLLIARVRYGEEMMNFLESMSPEEAATFIQIIETKNCIQRGIPIIWDSIERKTKYYKSTGLVNAIEKNPWIIDKYPNEIFLAIRKKTPYIKELIVHALMNISKQSKKALEILHILEGDRDIADIVIRCLSKIGEKTQRWKNHQHPDAIRSALEKRDIEIKQEYKIEKSLPIYHVERIPPWKQPEHSTVKSILWSPDGRFLICHANKSPTISVMEIWRDDELIYCVEHVEDPLWSPNGKYIIARKYGALVIIDPNDFRVIKNLTDNIPAKIRLAEWSTDGERILAVTDRNDIYIINMDGKYRHIEIGPLGKEEISWLCWGPDNKEILVATDKRIILLEEKGDKWYVKNQTTLNSDIYVVKWSPNDDWIAVALRDGTVIILNKNLSTLYEIKNLSKEVPCTVDWSDDGIYLACLAPKYLYIIDARTGKIVWVIPIPSSTFNSPPPKRGVSWGPKYQIATINGRNIDIWAAGEGYRIKRLAYYMSQIEHIDCSPDGGYIACLSDDATIHIWDTTTLQEIRIIRMQEPLRQIKWSPDGRYIAGISKNKVYIWDIKEERIHGKINCRYVESIAWSPDGEKIAFGSGGELYIYNVVNNDLLKVWLDYISMRELSWSPNGKYIATISDDYTISIIDAKTFREIRTIRETYLTKEDKAVIEEYIYEIRMIPKTYKLSLCWSPDSEKIAYSEEPGIIAIQKIRSGRQIFRYVDPGADYHSLSWSPDGKYIATACEKGIDIFSVDENKKISHGFLLPAMLKWSPNGKYIATVKRTTRHLCTLIFAPSFNNKRPHHEP